jgi:hypothetical protein
LTSRSSGVVAELSAQNSSSSRPAPAGSSSSRADQASSAHRPAGRATQADHLEAGQLLGSKQALEHSGGEGGVAAAALAGDRHPGSSGFGHPHHCRALVGLPPEVHSERASTGSARTLPVGLHGQVVRQVDGRFDSLVQAEPML